MELWIGLQSMPAVKFLEMSGVKSCLQNLTQRGHTWHMAGRKDNETLDIPALGLQEDAAPAALLTDNDFDADLGDRLGYTVFGLGTEGIFSNAAMIFENSEALTAGFIEMKVCHAAAIPYYLSSQDGTTLRESIEEDFESLYEIFRESSMPMFDIPFPSGGAPIVLTNAVKPDYQPDNNTRYKQTLRETFLEYIHNQYRFYGFGIWSVLTAEGTVIGWCGFSIEKGPEPDLGFIIHKDYRRRHLAYQACQAAIRFAREELQLPEIALYTDRTNTASAKLACKLGFTLVDEKADGEQLYRMIL